jgi:hypothetical protein
MVGRIVFLVGVCLALLAVAPRPVVAADVGCGATITTSITLTHDLLDCPGAGLVIGAPNITLNLDGYAIEGSGVGAGIDNSAGHDNVSVDGSSVESRETTVRGFVRGVYLVGAQDNRVQWVSTVGGAVGFDVRNSPGTDLVDEAVSGASQFGVRLVGSAGASVVEMFGVEGRRRDVLVRGSHTTLDEVVSLRRGIDIRGNENRVVAVGVQGRAGLHVVGSRNSIEGNSFEGFGARIATNGIWIESGTANLVKWNDVVGTAKDGVLIGALARGTVVDTNWSHQNADDGIDVNNATTTITANTTDNNGDLGIEAVAGVSDGGGNHATGNGNPAQCTGVVCG